MEATLEAVKRDGRGKNEAQPPARLRPDSRRRLRHAPRRARRRKASPVAVDPKALLRILHSDSGANTLINLKLDGGESRVMVKEYQLDPVTHQLLHADFYQLAMDKAITVTVPIVLKGEPRASSCRAACSTSSPATSRCSACRPTFPSTSTSTSPS